MALTREEEEELLALETQLAAFDDTEAGDKVISAVDAARLKPRKAESRPFSTFRATAGGLRDTAQNIFDFVEDAGDAMQRAVPLPVVRFGSSAGNGVIDVITGQEATDFTNTTRNTPVLGNLRGSENAGTAERVVRGITSFAVPFAGWSRTFGVAKGASWLGRAGRATLAGGVTDAMMNPQDTNMANMLRDTFGFDNAVLDSLASEEDDARMWARFKAAAVNAPVGIAADAIMQAGFKGLQAYRAWRGSVEEADAAVKAARADLSLDRGAVATLRNADEAINPESVSEAAREGARRSADEGMGVKPDKTPEDFEDILDFLQNKAGLSRADVDEELLSRFAFNLIEGNPENALAKMGIDPLKLDYSKFDNPDMLGRMQRGLAEVYEGIASKLGRTGQRIGEEQITMAARTMATTADALKDLYGNTANLAETFMASRLFVGSHAHKLVSEAEAALAAIKAGAGDDEWVRFLESFYRHAYFLGALRGAGSEVGRALKQLQMVAKVGKKTARAGMKSAVKSEGKKEMLDPRAVAQAATDSVGSMQTPAEKMLFLAGLVEKGGDVGDLSRLVRTKAGSTLKRLDDALGETRGNLFSSSTGVLNILSGTSMLGLRSLGKALAGVGRMALSPFGKANSVAARAHFMEAWAYVDGTLSGWRAGIGNAMALLEREAGAELALNADTYGAKDLAAWAAAKSTEGTAAIKGEKFERVDIVAKDRAFSITAADQRHLREQMAQWNTPALMQHAVSWLVKGLAAPVNAAGTLSRLGTILFINAPDQLMGTIAAKAGAQAHAVRLAASEAAELQLEGPALSQYLKARTVQLTGTVDGFADDAYSAGQREVALAHGNEEARAILFQDDLEFGVSRALSNGLSRVPVFHMFVPFLRTPLRILERTVIDNTPLGFLKDRIRADILAGGPRRDEALARIGLGTAMVATAFNLADDRTIIGQDGDYRSTARLSRPSYTLMVGDDAVEFNRIDPLGTLLGWGADVRAYLQDQEDNPNASEGATRMIEAAIIATQANILNKTWLTSLKNLTELADKSSDEEFSARLRTYTQSFGARLVPASGIQRSIEKGIEGVNREASGFIEGAIGASVGADKLPVKRDRILGRPVGYSDSDRLFGIKGGPGASDLDEPLLAELERLSFDMPSASRTVKGVRLNSAQFSRWLELRGQEVRSPTTGLTLEESLSEIIKLPEYQALPRLGRIQAMREEMRGFGKLATEQLMEEDRSFATAALQKEVWNEGRPLGRTREELDADTARFAEALGFTPEE